MGHLRAVRDSTTGILLMNLGTPEAAEPEAVGRYLREFLMDPYVIDIPTPARWMLVNLAIVPRRKFTSAKAYKTIWTERGSPLASHLQDLTAAIRRELPGTPVESAMRYGQPLVVDALRRLQEAGVRRVIVAPLYPQYAESSSRSSFEYVESVAAKKFSDLKLQRLAPFYDHPAHIEAWAAKVRDVRKSFAPNLFLMSYHGLPERHLKKADPTGSHCLNRADCCEEPGLALATCYRAQCIATTRRIAQSAGLRPGEYAMSFQSRLGRTPWIKPYTDEVVPELPQTGVERLAVLTPAFVADCLETIEEVGDRLKHQFLSAGGKEFHRIECPNADPAWVEGLARILVEAF